MREMSRQIPKDHPIRKVFHTLTDISCDQVGVKDRDIIGYISDLLVEFVHIDNLYKLRNAQGKRLEYIIDMLMEIEQRGPLGEREARKHIGDYSLFIVGLFPESLQRRRRALSPRYYIDQGKEAYLIVAEIEGYGPTAALFRKLSDRFEDCVWALNLEREYLRDPFYQYLLRQFA
ncbi:MAG: hypothetical protein D6736_10995 [Nitrospinota bacterium]|nr:MAG: hypothetical protein D6736_10995 [Nitrospinota bacterium]